VSIIVPCYKKEKYLRETLDSVLSQTYKKWECIIVDDGSPDNCYAIAKEYCDKDSRFFVIHQTNKGVSAARNNGIQHSHGKYILPLDADDVLASTYLEKAIDKYKEVPEAKLVYCLAKCIGGNNSQYTLPSFDYSSFLKQSIIYCTALFKRDDYELTSGYNPNMQYGLEDWDFWLSLIDENDIVCCINEELFYYRISESSRTEKTIAHLSEMEIQIFKNHPDKYFPVASNWIVLNRQLRDLTNELLAAKEELTRTRNSFAFRLGKLLLRPFSIIRHQLY
jgi:glycosyltransferase involved in cell wall biosynthesis